MATATIIKLTPKCSLVSLRANERQLKSTLVYIKKEESDEVGDIIDIQDGYKVVPFFAYDEEQGVEVRVTTNSGIGCNTLEWPTE